MSNILITEQFEPLTTVLVGVADGYAVTPVYSNPQICHEGLGKKALLIRL